MSAEAETKVKFAEDPSAPKKGGRKSSVMVNRRASKANASMVSESADESIPAIQRHRKRSVIGGMDEIDLEKRELKEKHDAERAAREASGSVDGIPEDPGLVEYYKSMDALKGKSPFDNPIFGDIFSAHDKMHENSLLGMMYHSRIQESAIEALKRIGKDGEQDRTATTTHDVLKTEDSLSMIEEQSDEDPESLVSLNSRQQLALTIKNWSFMADNDKHLIEEGAVHALIGLAGLDDNFVKKCCATALCNLAERVENREALLKLGAASGTIQIAKSNRTWRIAKLCAKTLCCLTMQKGGEELMANHGAILALQLLLGLKGYRLLPIAAQSLYNLTCVENHYKGVERSIKAFLALPATAFDTSLCFMKSVVNCCRFSWIRMRIIEDGCLAGMATISSQLDNKAKDVVDELVRLIAIALRFMSDNDACRIEIIAKGGLDILLNILPYALFEARTMIVVCLYNLMQHDYLNNAQFEKCAHIACQVINASTEDIIFEYASTCLYKLAEDNVRGNTKLANMIMDVVGKYMGSAVPLTQYFAVATAGNLFFLRGTETKKLEHLIYEVLQKGKSLQNVEASEGLSIALAKLTQDDFSMSILERRGFYDDMLTLLLKLLEQCKGISVAMESCAIGICRIALKLGDDGISAERKKKMAQLLIELLENDDAHLIGNVIASIRALGDAKICQQEFLDISDSLFSKLATIVVNHGNGNQLLNRNCCALIAGFSYSKKTHAGLAAEDVLEVLFITTRSDDKVSRELVAITICNMTMSPEASQKLIKFGVCDIIATLSGATSELIQELCAKCICNLTCVVDLHSLMIQSGILQTILMIALVRTVEDKTKLICARSVMNLISDDNIEALKEAGAIRVFASIATVNNQHINNQCAQGFLIFTTTPARREDICNRRPAMQALFLMIKSPSPQCRIIVGMTVCNLLACPKSQRSAINAGALQVLKIICTMEYPQLREASARVIINLVQEKSLHPLLLATNQFVPMINCVLHKSGDGTNPSHENAITIFNCCAHAMSAVSYVEEFRDHVLTSFGHSTLVNAVLTGRVDTIEVATEIVRTFCLLSYETDKIPMMIDSHVLLTLHMLYKKGLLTPASAAMCGIMIRNASIVAERRAQLVSGGAILLLRALYRPLVEKNHSLMTSIIITLDELSKEDDLHETLMEQGTMAMIYDAVLPVFNDRSKCDSLFPIHPSSTYASIVHNESYEALCAKESQHKASLNKIDIQRVSSAIHNLTQTESSHISITMAECTQMFKKFINGAIDDCSRSDIAKSFEHLASCKAARQKLVNDGAVECLLIISKATTNSETQVACTVALGYLSEITKVAGGDVDSLLTLNITREETKEMKHKIFDPNGDRPVPVHLMNEDVEKMASGDANGDTSRPISSEMSTRPSSTESEAEINPETGRPKSRGATRLRQMIKGGLLAGKNKQLLKHGGYVEDGVLVSSKMREESHKKDGLDEEAMEKMKKKTMLLNLFMDKTYDERINRVTVADILVKEMATLNGNHNEYKYSTYDNSGTFTTEYGGVGTQHHIDLPLPSIVTARMSNADSKTTGLSKVEPSMTSLEKETHILDDVDDSVIATQTEELPEHLDSTRNSSRAGTAESQNLVEETQSSKKNKSLKKSPPKKVIPDVGAAWQGMQGKPTSELGRSPTGSPRRNNKSSPINSPKTGTVNRKSVRSSNLMKSSHK